jgi:RNA polymerase-binding transcription factor
MNSTPDFESIRQRLEEERDNLGARVAAAEKQLSAPLGANPDHSELAQQYASGERRSAVLEQSRRQLGQVEAALGRLAEGTYGRCLECGKPINLQRLKALPDAPLCLDCQKRQTQHG